jgi:hypothetical protein
MRRFFSRPRRERGAVAIMVAALAIVLFGVAALGVDLASQVNRKHLLKNQLDAAATAAAYYLDTDTTGIKDAATNAITYFAKNGQGTLDPGQIDFWCVVARKLNTDNTPANPAQVAAYQIPSLTQSAGICNPDAASASTDWKMSDYQNRVRYDGQVFKMSCSTTLCAIPCALQAKPANNWNPGLSISNNRAITCNTVRVGAEQGVPFSFAPVLGIHNGSTGSQIATACKGSCGSVAPNPMNVVVVTDRTSSMCASSNLTTCTDEHSMIQGIKDMLAKMSPAQQYVALGTIGRSTTTTRTSFNTNCSTVGVPSDSSERGYGYSGDSLPTYASNLWVPLQFYSNYQGSAGALNTSSDLVRALNCLDPNGSGPRVSHGTYLAAPLKAAARYVLGDQPSMDSAGFNVAGLGGASRSGRIRNVIIFETDGQPQELTTWNSDDPTKNACGVTDSLTAKVSGCGNGYDVFSDMMHVTKAGTSEGTPGTTFASKDTGLAYNSTSWSTYKPTVTPTNCYTSGGMTNSNCSGAGAYKLTYNTVTNTRTDAQNYERDGGENACSNFLAVADTIKAYDPDDLIITIGYNLDGSTTCNKGNANPDLSSLSKPANSTDYPGAWIEDIDRTDNNGNWGTTNGTRQSDCVSGGNGTTAAQAKSIKQANCKVPLTVTYNVATKVTWTNAAVDTNPGPTVNSVLAAASGGQGIDAAAVDSGGCSTPTSRTAENSDGDFFFCGASGDDMGPIFVTALSQVGGGVKLINLPH